MIRFQWMRLTLTLCGGLTALLLATASWAERAEQCLRTQVKGANLHYENVCDYPITVFYCATEKPLLGGSLCGSGGAAKSFYTHRRVMAKRTADSFYQRVDIRFAVCQGEIPISAFSSTGEAAYQCEKAAAPAARSKFVPPEGGYSMAVKTSRESACAAAKALAPQGDACACDTLGSPAKTYYRCWVAFPAEEPDSIILRFKGELRRKVEALRAEHCAENPADCTPKRPPSGGLGVRG